MAVIRTTTRRLTNLPCESEPDDNSDDQRHHDLGRVRQISARRSSHLVIVGKRKTPYEYKHEVGVRILHPQADVLHRNMKKIEYFDENSQPGFFFDVDDTYADSYIYHSLPSFFGVLRHGAATQLRSIFARPRKMVSSERAKM